MVKVFIVDGFTTIIGDIKNFQNETGIEDSFYAVENPFILNMTMNENNKLTYTPIPAVLNKQNIAYHINKSKIMVDPFDPSPELEQFFSTVTGSIKIVNSSLIL